MKKIALAFVMKMLKNYVVMINHFGILLPVDVIAINNLLMIV
jgi:hypothetical protein